MNNEMKLLKCGCSAQEIHRNIHDGLLENHPSCFIHNCCEITVEPNLEGRIAKCGTSKNGIGRYNECDDCRGKNCCSCEKPSSLKLAFFKHNPTEEFDSYYCGCIGWD